MTDKEIARKFCALLEREKLDPCYPSYIAFTDAHWERFKTIRQEFCSKHRLSTYDHAPALAQGVFLYIANELMDDLWLKGQKDAT